MSMGSRYLLIYNYIIKWGGGDSGNGGGHGER